MTLSTPVKVFALAALALMLGLGGFVFLFASHGSTAPERIVVAHHTTHTTTPGTKATPAAKAVAPKAPAIDPSLPAPLRHALEHSNVVVAVVYSSNVAGDRRALVEARAGAQAAHVGFAALNVHDEKIAEGVSALEPTVDPAVFVINRGSPMVLAAAGQFDRQTVAAAAVSAR
jgi:hypothetical protein